MTLNEFFNSELVSLPKGGFDDGTETFDKFLETLFERYLTQLRSLDDASFPELKIELQSLVTGSERLAHSIVRTVRDALAGRGDAAYRELSGELSNIDWTQFVIDLSASDDSIDLSDPYSTQELAIHHPPLYRVRSERSEFNIPDRGDIFHVPFEKRRLVSNQRYSVTGLPCLYLGSSLWICWEELGRPPLDSLWVSRFKFAEPVRVIDFQFSPHQVWGMFDAHRSNPPIPAPRNSEVKLKTKFSSNFLKSYARYWPLIASCSIRREQRIGNFVPEFIVPQLLLQWVAGNELLDGIRYFSVRTPTRGNHVLGHSNCVFPVKTVSFRGYCSKLAQTFALTQPVSWETLTAINLENRSVITNKDINAWAPIKVNNDLDLRYFETDFFHVERKLEDIENRPNCSRTITTISIPET